MRFAPCTLLFLALFPYAAAGQRARPSLPTAPTVSALPAEAADQSLHYAALREDVGRKNKVLQDQVSSARAIVKKNQELLRQAQKLNASNHRLAEERKKLEAQSVSLERERESLQSAQASEEFAEAGRSVSGSR